MPPSAPPEESSLQQLPPSQAVRFASVNQEIEPSRSMQSQSQPSSSSRDDAAGGPAIHPQMEKEIRELALSLKQSNIHQPHRMHGFSYEPCSLPTSRVPSNESTPYHSSREVTKDSPRTPSQVGSAITTPPLTPHGTQGAEASSKEAAAKAAAERAAVQQAGATSSTTASSTGLFSTADENSTRPTSAGSSSTGPEARKEVGFAVGPATSASSASPSRGDSPATLPQDSGATSGAPSSIGTPRGSITNLPEGEKDDPYARSRRAPQPRNAADIDSRFVFGNNDSRRKSSAVSTADNSTSSLPRAAGGKEIRGDYRKSAFSVFGGGGGGGGSSSKGDHSGSGDEKDKPHGSMSDLKRFFGMGGHHHHHKQQQQQQQQAAKRAASPAAAAAKKAAESKSSLGTRTPTDHVPFADDHGLEKKYGKFGKMLGSGAGGSVRVLKRASDGRTFAVKQFRDRHNYETPREYNKKVTAEFCIGSTLHHGNIIETLDIVQEGGHWFEVMEYAPFDLFAIVMTGKMSREEVACCFLQITNGVAFLHSSGLAHRDLKLDNVVVNEHGIMKIIDFGSAAVFRYPFENDVICASGIVGSDPYLAPEVYDEKKYDPQPADVWSLAIIFACMSLRRFPWKMPRVSDNSYKMFIAEPHTNPEDLASSSSGRAQSTPYLGDKANNNKDNDGASQHHHHHHQHHNHHGNADGSTNNDGAQSAPASRETTHQESTPPPQSKQPEVIRGPWRLLRLLPRESRSIIGAMLQIDPRKRATLADIFAEPWVSNAAVCEQLEHGKIVRAGTHEHILEPGSTTPAPSRNK